MPDLTVTIKVRGNYRDGLDQTAVPGMLKDAMYREARVLQAGGFSLQDVDVVVGEDPVVNRATGIEDPPRRMCQHCGRFIGYAHSPECDRDGQVELKDTVDD